MRCWFKSKIKMTSLTIGVQMCLGFVAGVLGHVFSPSFEFGIGLVESVKISFLQSILFSVGIVISSRAIGCNDKMLYRLKIDYLVNQTVAAILGCLFTVFVAYIFRFQLIGRWVASIAVVVYVVFVYMISAIDLFRSSVEFLIVGKESDRLRAIEKDFLNFTTAGSYRFLLVNTIEDLEKFFLTYTNNGNTCLIVCADFFDELKWLKSNGKYIRVLEECFSSSWIIENELGIVHIEALKGLSWWEISTDLRRKSYSSIKRILDIIIIIILGFPASIVALAAALLVKITDGGPVFYRQIRLGQYGVPFYIYKIRTMIVQSEITGPQWAKKSDPRVTAVGKFLRKTRIDEIPQFWNILRGEMSFVGPRPERPEFYSLIDKELPEFSLRLVCKPGLTGWAQVNYPYGASVDDSRKKLQFDIYYIYYWSLSMDFKIIIRTFVAMVKGAR
jgi:lipopolysaccharide/colanic/teichoic acid biosynthesis glycosyltransferase